MSLADNPSIQLAINLNFASRRPWRPDDLVMLLVTWPRMNRVIAMGNLRLQHKHSSISSGCTPLI